MVHRKYESRSAQRFFVTAIVFLESVLLIYKNTVIEYAIYVCVFVYCLHGGRAVVVV